MGGVRRGEEEDSEGTMTDGHWRRGEEEGIRAGVGGHWHRFKAPAKSEWRYSTSTESWGCEKRCDVDLGSSYDRGWRQSHYRCLIGQMRVFIVLPFFFLLDSVGVRKQQRSNIPQLSMSYIQPGRL